MADLKLPERDSLTGLYTLQYFFKDGEALLASWRGVAKAPSYVLIYFDILRFKMVNEVFGVNEGDRFLKYMAQAISNNCTSNDRVGRIISDKFVVLLDEAEGTEKWIDNLLISLEKYDLPMEVICSFGIYRIEPDDESLFLCLDRAILAQSTIKGSYVKKYAYYDESMRDRLLSEQEIAGSVNYALSSGQFVVYYQPQFSHHNSHMVGAEALVRWRHPVKGMISPAVFIPILENTGYIYALDLYVFEQSCQFLANCLKEHLPVVPISSNFSPYDIFQSSFVDKLEEIRSKYGISAKLLRVEITESAVMGGADKTNAIVHRLNELGYLVEMDDFGSGYSSLNVLKDIDFNIIKLDMRFLRNSTDNKRGGTILSSMVRMLQGLGVPVIAEGVETIAQADYLESIGCDCMQGYLYSKPLPEDDFRLRLLGSQCSCELVRTAFMTIDDIDFWEPDSQGSLLFNNFVGPAAIFSFHNGECSIYRVNKKYLRELGMNNLEDDVVAKDFSRLMDGHDKQAYSDMLEKAIVSGEEAECETWRLVNSGCCGEEQVCVRSTVRLLGKHDNFYLFFGSIRNITQEKQRVLTLEDSERRFKVASEQANIYYWEYDVLTKDMRPCFRCMRDLGFPPLVHNYPESAIKMAIFPPDEADDYREMMRKIDAGADKLEGLYHLTVGRVPFIVRYTTEFDEAGRPVKAYGSATLAVDN